DHSGYDCGHRNAGDCSENERERQRARARDPGHLTGLHDFYCSQWPPDRFMTAFAIEGRPRRCYRRSGGAMTEVQTQFHHTSLLAPEERVIWRRFVETHAAIVRRLDEDLRAHSGLTLSSFEVLYE